MSVPITLPRSVLDRLSRLSLACDDRTGVLQHIALHVTTESIRFSATDGCMLASLVHPNQHAADPFEAILDRDQLTAACKTLVKASAPSVTITISPHEARFTCGTSSVIVRRHAGDFPNFDHVFGRTAGQRWLPSLCSLDPHRITTAQRIAGKTPVLFLSPAQPATLAHLLWNRQADDNLPASTISVLLATPAYWADHELAILLMPVTRTVDVPGFDLSRFTIAKAPALALAA